CPRRFWIAHRAEAGRWDLARGVLTELAAAHGNLHQPWAAAHYRAQGSYAGYIADLDVLWRHAEEEDDYASAFRCGLITATTHSLGANLSLELIVGLVTIGTPQGRWTLSGALEHIRQMPYASQQLEAFTGLLDATAQQTQWP